MGALRCGGGLSTAKGMVPDMLSLVSLAAAAQPFFLASMTSIFNLLSFFNNRVSKNQERSGRGMLAILDGEKSKILEYEFGCFCLEYLDIGQA